MPSPPPPCASKLGRPPPMIAPWHKYLPLASKLPRSLWLTGGALLLALLSYGFRAELWPNHPTAGGLSLGLLPIVLVVAPLQLPTTLYRWMAAIAAPGWLRLVFHAGMAVVQVAIAMLIVVVLLGSLITLALLS